MQAILFKSGQYADTFEWLLRQRNTEYTRHSSKSTGNVGE